MDVNSIWRCHVAFVSSFRAISKRRPATTCVLSVLCFFCYAIPALAFNCSMAATNIAFGNIDVTTGAAVSSSGTFTVTCSGSPSGQYMRMCVSVNGGSASDSTSRLMNGPGAAQLRFQLYSDTGYTTPWGSWPANLYGGGYTWDVLGTTSTSTGTITFYGQVLANQQTITAGSYSSSLTLFFTYDDHNNVACPENGKGNSSTSFTATATVTTSCNVSATTLNFGSTGSLASTIDATSPITVQCTNGAPYTLGLSAGNNAGGNPLLRRVIGGPSNELINYSLFSDAARTINWGNTSGTNWQTSTGTGGTQTFTVYGRVPGGQFLPQQGVYTDNVVVTVSY